MCGSDAPRAPDYTQHNNNLLTNARASNTTNATNYNNAISAFNLALTGGNRTTGGTQATTTYKLPEITSGYNLVNNNMGNGSGGHDWERQEYWKVGGKQFSSQAQAKAYAEANKIATTTPGTPGKTENVVGWSTKIGDFLKLVNGTGYDKFWDDPTTKGVNENAYLSLFDQGTKLRNDFAALVAPTAPELTKRLQGGGGAVLEITDLPTLSQANMTLYNQLNGDLGKALTRLETLKSERAAEEARVKGFVGNLNTTLSGYKTGLGQLTMADKSAYEQLERDLSSVKTQMGGFSSSILGQLGGFGTINDTITGISNGITGLRNARTAEEKRITDFESGILGQVDTIRNGMKGLGIDDLDALTGYKNQIEQQLIGANRFSSKLGFDLSQETGELNQVYGTINTLLGKRDDELKRISTAQDQFKRDANSLKTMLGSAGVYDLSTINNYGGMIQDLRDGISGFKSDLGADFSGIDLAGLDAAFKELQGKRTTALNPFSTELGTLGTGIGSIALEDEATRKARMDKLNDLRVQLSSYTGSDVDGMRTQLNSYLKTLNDQAGELSTKRGDLNTQAEALLKAIKDGSYYDSSDVVQRQEEAKQLKALVDQFGVSNATDEMSAIEAFLNGQTNRLEGDAQAQLAEQEKAQSMAQRMLAGNPIESMLGAQNLGDDEIRQLLAMMAQEDDPMAQRMMGTFGQLVGA